MTTVTRQQIIDFVRAQPNDRPVNMDENSNNETGCGCVMIHYGREILKLSQNDFEGCGCTVWEGFNGDILAKIENRERIEKILSVKLYFRGTYGDIKTKLS